MLHHFPLPDQPLHHNSLLYNLRSAAIKYAGISAVLAKSFARIFYRNCFNLGLPAIEVNTDQFEDGDEVEVYLDNGFIVRTGRDRSQQKIKIPPLPKTMQTLLSDGGFKL